ncbi:hypothetical protein HHK36_003916 [Tetracentron sinense]|uniref:Uncharacterized protein n=1 Tax=Tetracentron sinense TaxID=13715 RepID=A0A834ZZF0_TETSI|nr:hypothetical protein HHK36_003916 [Tetracentron sinense]
MMSVSGSLQLSHELGICKNHGRRNQFKSVVGRGQLHLLRVSLSSRALRQDAWSLHLLDSVHKPIHSVSSGYNVFICRSLLTPGRGNEIPIVKTAAMALTRSYNALHGSPLVLQLVPAFGIIAFAVWGLGPLMRQSRKIFLNRSDSSWKKSSTHYVLTSYLQPLLLWIGATLICRALDPVVLPSEASQAVKQRLLNFVRSLSTVLAFAYCLSSLIQQAQKFFMETNDSSDTRNNLRFLAFWQMGFQFAGKSIYTAVWVAAVSLFMELLGFSTQKWLTAGGLGTVLLTLAGREIFTNFLSSVMIHATRPFVVNEWIQTKIEGYEVSGTVEHVGWWSPTIIRGEDREALHIPNHKFTMNVVRNLSQKTHWRVKTHLAISHLDVNKINNIVADMRKVLAKNPQVEQQRLHRRVFLDNVNQENQALLVQDHLPCRSVSASSYVVVAGGNKWLKVQILVSCFVKTSHFEEYLCVKEAILLDLLRVISHHRARLATPIRTVQKVYSDADIDNIPFGDTIFTRAGAATNHPFLLIEPPYRINGDDKTKAQSRSVRTNVVQDAKVVATRMPDSKADTKVGTTSTSDSKADVKVGVAPASDSKADGKVSATSASDSKTDSKVAAMSDSKTPGFTDGSVQNNSDKQPKKASLGDARQNSKVDSVPMVANASTSPPKSHLEGVGLNSKDKNLVGPTSEEPLVTLSETGGEKAGVTPATSLSKQESERVPVAPPSIARPALEENIVLGVALEGSRRTLPIEEGMAPSPTPAEGKELATCRNGNGSPAGKDKKDSQLPTVPGATAGD